MRPVVCAVLLSIVAPAAVADECAFTAPRSFNLDAGSARALILRTGAGSLRVEGTAGIAAVTAEGTACASSQALLDQIRIVGGREGNNLRVDTEMPDLGSGWGWSSSYAALDLVVRLPAALALELTDSSGEARVAGVASLKATDSSGEFEVARIAGPVELNDSSGELRIEDCVGPVTVQSDSSGSLRIARIDTAVNIVEDSSGEIEVSDVRGDVRVGNDSSGSMTFKDIGGSVEVGNDSSGGIEAHRVGGSFTVRSDGSGGIDYSDVRGPVSVPKD